MKVMKEYETLKVYGKIANRWNAFSEERGREVTTQVEVEYKEFDHTGKLIATGTEDFSPARLDEQTNYYEVWGWDGSHLNRGGHKYFDRLLDYRRINRKDVYKLRWIARQWFPNDLYVEFSVRGF